MATLRARVSDVHGDDRLDSLSECVATGKLDPYAAADLLVERLAQPSALDESSEFAQGLTHPEGEGGFDEWPAQSSDRTQREIEVLGPEEA